MNASLRKIGALLQKDLVDLVKNPAMSVVCLMPIGFMLLYRIVIGDVTADAGLDARQAALAGQEILKFTLGSALCMTIGMVGSMIEIYGIAEEKEKHTLRTLMLANVGAGEVAASKTLLALLAISVDNFACFFIAGGDVSWLGSYMALGLVGSIPVVLVSLVLGLACRDQMTAGFYSVPVLLVALVPMFGMADENLARIASLTPLGGIYDLMGMAVDGTLISSEALSPLAVTAAWIAAGCILFAALFKRVARDN